MLLCLYVLCHYAFKNMSFKIEDDEVYVKYNQVWNEIKELLGGVL